MYLSCSPKLSGNKDFTSSITSFASFLVSIIILPSLRSRMPIQQLYRVSGLEGRPGRKKKCPIGAATPMRQEMEFGTKSTSILNQKETEVKNK